MHGADAKLTDLLVTLASSLSHDAASNQFADFLPLFAILRSSDPNGSVSDAAVAAAQTANGASVLTNPQQIFASTFQATSADNDLLQGIYGSFPNYTASDALSAILTAQFASITQAISAGAVSADDARSIVSAIISGARPGNGT